MTKEELAEKWVKENCCDYCVNADDCATGGIECNAIKAFIAGAQERTEKLKCCGNCAFDGQIKNASYKYYSRCAYECKNYSLWEVKEC